MYAQNYLHLWPRKADDAATGRFMKRLLAFFLPQSQQFSACPLVRAAAPRHAHLARGTPGAHAVRLSPHRPPRPRQKPSNLVYVTVGCRLLSQLLASPEGVRVIVESDLINQVRGEAPTFSDTVQRLKPGVLHLLPPFALA